MPRVKISALGCYTPPRVLTNHDLEKLVETSDQWILERTGIRERHIADPEIATSDMAVEAAKCALAQRGVNASELNAIIVCTVTPDHMFPSTACLVQNRIGARGAWGFDLIAACSSFVYGLTTGAHLVAAGTHKKVLVIGSDTMSRIIDYTDRATCILFGDGAGAFLIEPDEIQSLALEFLAARKIGLQADAADATTHMHDLYSVELVSNATLALRTPGRAGGVQIRRPQDVRNMPRFIET